MAVSNYVLYSGRSNSGIQSNKNEDYIVFREYDDILFSAIADGSGSKDSDANPAAIAAMQTADIIGRICKKDKGLLLSNAKLLMEEAILAANNILIGYKLGNEEKYYGFATTLTALLLQPNGTPYFRPCWKLQDLPDPRWGVKTADERPYKRAAAGRCRIYD